MITKTKIKKVTPEHVTQLRIVGARNRPNTKTPESEAIIKTMRRPDKTETFRLDTEDRIETGGI